MRIKKTVSFTIDKKTEALLERLGNELLMDDNKSHVIRYAIKYTAMKLLENR